MFNKFKGLLEDDALFYAVVIIFIAVSSFGLGRYSVDSEQLSIPKQGITIIQPPSPASLPSSVGSAIQEDKYVASKNGTKYYLLWCSGVGRIKEENKIYFSTKEEAQANGYTPAANCKGI